MLPSSRLLGEEPTNTVTGVPVPRYPPTGAPPVLPSIVVDDVDGNDDDPPPYSAVAPPNHVGWPFNFSGIQCSTCDDTRVYGSETAPLAAFQTTLTSPNSTLRPDETDSQQHSSISMPLMPCRLFMFGSHGSVFAHGGLPFTDNISVTKDTNGRTRKYGAILIGAAVIIFLMALSLLVRFVMDKNLWRG